jgi:hypothetical protein
MTGGDRGIGGRSILAVISKHYGAKLSGIVGKHAHLPTCRAYMTIHSAGFDT